MKRISIFWKNDSDELVEMMQELDDPGFTVGNDGCEIAVTDSEYEDILEYAEKHSDSIVVEFHEEVTKEEAQELAKDWQ